MAEETTGLYAGIVIGSLPPDEGISLTMSTGYAIATDIEKSDAYAMYAVLNGKSAYQEQVSNALNDIHETLTHRKDYPNVGKYQITNIATVAAPNLIEREQNKQWLYGSSIRIDFYFRNIENPAPVETAQEIQETQETQGVE